MPVRLEDDDVLGRLRALDLPGDDLLELVHLEPVEDALLHGLDQVARLELRLLARVAADERRALEHGVVELAPRRVVRADRTDERALAQPLAAQHRILRRRDGHDDVGVGSLPVRLRRLAAVLAAEVAEPLGVAAVDLHPLERRHGRADARDLAAACQPQPITPRLAAPSRARYRAATPEAAPVRSCPSLSASITAAMRVGGSRRRARRRTASPSSSSA